MSTSRMKTVLTTFALAIVAGAANATVTYEPKWTGTLADDGGTAIADGTLILVMDLDGDGFEDSFGNTVADYESGSFNAPTDTWLWDTDDLVLDRTRVGNPLAGWAFPSEVLDISTVDGYDAGVDQWYAIWFDTPYDESAAGPGTDTSFGIENMGVAGNDGDTLTPTGVGGSSTFSTTAIPEPSSLLLGILAMAAVVRRRRINR